MRIKRIEIAGFKSFCDRAVFEISQPITAVVGPNGCGKSNIVDAIRWCMGEQSAKHLRGRQMEDVIFSGSDSRGPADMAEVSLTFDEVSYSPPAADAAEEENLVGVAEASFAADLGPPAGAAGDEPWPLPGEGRDLPGPHPGDLHGVAQGAGSAPDHGDGGGGAVLAGGAGVEADAMPASAPPLLNLASYSEVTITRRLFRDGTSVYLLNKVPCRLRDIVEFFLGTGAGTKAYSIIEQGRVGMIVSARPQDRRALIEEAAGITKFKAKKKAAERKLEKTRHNLLRVSDIVAELDKRMGSLQRQAQKAERYRRYRAEQRDIELWIASHRYLELVAGRRVLESELEAHEHALEQARSAFERADAAILAERAELAVEERRLSRLQEAQFDLDNRAMLTGNKIEFEKREALGLDERVADAAAETHGVAARLAECDAQLARHRQEVAALQGELLAEVEARDRSQAELDAISAEVAAAQSDLENDRLALARARADLARAEIRREARAKERTELEGRRARLRAEIEECKRQRSEIGRGAKQIERALADLRQMRLDLGHQGQDFAIRQRDLENTAERSEAEVEALRGELERRKSRLQSLVEIHERYEGFARGTRAAMQNWRHWVTEGGSEHPAGIVADVLQPRPGLEWAVEAALGERLGGVLVGSPEVSLGAIRYLRETGAGRSTFVPCSPVAGVDAAAGGKDGRAAAPSADRGAGSGEGVLGPLAELVEFAPGYEGLGNALFAPYLLVDHLDTAVKLHRRGARETLVTLDGDVLDARGVVSGGSAEQPSGVLAQKREIRELEEMTASLESDLAAATARLVTNKAALRQVTLTLEHLRNQRQDGEMAIMGHEKDLVGCRAELERLSTRIGELGRDELELGERWAEQESQEQQTRGLEAAARAAIEGWEQSEVLAAERVSEGQARGGEVARVLTEAKVRLARMTERKAASVARLQELEVQQGEWYARLAALEETMEEGRERSESLLAEASELEQTLAALRERQRDGSMELEANRRAYDARVQRLQGAEVTARELRLRCEALAEDVRRVELALANLDADWRSLEATIEDRYRLALPSQVGDYHLRPRVGDGEERRLEELRALLDRMASDINLTAIAEYEQVSERHRFLCDQKDDLDAAVAQLERAIAKINRTSRQLFRDTFEAVNEQFQKVFPRLFCGGAAHLVLVGDAAADLLEAGVDIVAQPPGKKNRSVAQLSGGEKALTAVALIFAIFLIKPSPFCILDEVDAPLDDANVDRYNDLIRDVTDRSQFIVITHNKRTMARADQLHGVTMQEPGVSRLVSVNLAKLSERSAA